MILNTVYSRFTKLQANKISFNWSISFRDIIFNLFQYSNFKAASWRKRLGARLPPLGSRLRVSVPPCGFRGGRNGVWVGFHGVSPVFPYHKFHSIISPPSSHAFRFISSAHAMVRQAWSAGTLATHGSLI